MGYETSFEGHFTIDPPLKAEHLAFLMRFAQTERVQRDPEVLEGVRDPIREAAGLAVGQEGAFFLGGAGVGLIPPAEVAGQIVVVRPPKGQPNRWCRWLPSDDGRRLEWDGDLSFEAYVDWLDYLMHHCFKPWGYQLSGTVAWNGQHGFDAGHIEVHNNYVRVHEVGMGDDED